jgi:hypothetical protein
MIVRVIAVMMGLRDLPPGGRGMGMDIITTIITIMGR